MPVESAPLRLPGEILLAFAHKNRPSKKENSHKVCFLFVFTFEKSFTVEGSLKARASWTTSTVQRQNSQTLCIPETSTKRCLTLRFAIEFNRMNFIIWRSKGCSWSLEFVPKSILFANIFANCWQKIFFKLYAESSRFFTQFSKLTKR